MFPFEEENEDENLEEDEQKVPREYEIDFEKGRLTGRIVEGSEAIKTWIWLALMTQRYRYLIYSWDYGTEFEDFIGETHSEEYINSEARRMVEECLSVNPYITGIEDFECELQDEKITIRFKALTVYGEEDIDVRGPYI